MTELHWEHMWKRAHFKHDKKVSPMPRQEKPLYVDPGLMHT